MNRREFMCGAAALSALPAVGMPKGTDWSALQPGQGEGKRILFRLDKDSEIWEGVIYAAGIWEGP